MTESCIATYKVKTKIQCRKNNTTFKNKNVIKKDNSTDTFERDKAENILEPWKG